MKNTEKANDDPWRLDSRYPLADWVQEVTNDDTRMGYLAWSDHQRTTREESTPYTVHVGNVGNIYCETLKEAEEVFEDCLWLSRDGIGRMAYEPVTLTGESGDVIKEELPLRPKLKATK